MIQFCCIAKWTFVLLEMGLLSLTALAQEITVYGAIRELWGKLGWDGGKLGFPTSDEYDAPVDGVNGKRQDFEKGYIVWTPKKGARETISATM